MGDYNLTDRLCHGSLLKRLQAVRNVEMLRRCLQDVGVPVLVEREAQIHVNVFARKQAVVLANRVAALEHQPNWSHVPKLGDCVPFDKDYK